MRPTLTHIAIQVPAVEACIAFYRDFCDLEVIHRRASGVARLAEPGKESEFVFVLLPGGGGRDQASDVWDHLGFACASKAEVDDVAARGRDAGCLVWEPRQDDYPVGYYCALATPPSSSSVMASPWAQVRATWGSRGSRPAGSGAELFFCPQRQAHR